MHVSFLVAFPVKTTVWGLPNALSAMLSWPRCVPTDDGVKTRSSAQLEPGTSICNGAQEVLAARVNAEEEKEKELSNRFVTPRLVTVIVRAALTVPTTCAAKSSRVSAHWRTR